MSTFLTTSVFLVLIAAAASVIHRLNFEQAERIAVHRYSRALPGGPRSTDTAQPPATSTVQVAGRRRGSYRRVSALSHEPTQAHAEVSTGGSPPQVVLVPRSSTCKS
ncbi:hypothetical protein [Streptomyces sp. NPDC127190]|uniref:hypothetical protein n=1 Tax=Streptomyces sp. NPDC127190 TaxID=3345387 RepID=UPI00363D35D6